MWNRLIMRWLIIYKNSHKRIPDGIFYYFYLYICNWNTFFTNSRFCRYMEFMTNDIKKVRVTIGFHRLLTKQWKAAMTQKFSMLHLWKDFRILWKTNPSCKNYCGGKLLREMTRPRGRPCFVRHSRCPLQRNIRPYMRWLCCACLPPYRWPILFESPQGTLKVLWDRYAERRRHWANE